MFEISIERTFCAAHAIVIRGEREPVHGHNWRVRVTVAGDSLDADGLVCDFHELEEIVDRVIRPFRDRNLNETPPFDSVNPTAEHVARHIAQEVAAAVPDVVQLRSVSVTEAPGCIATYRPSPRFT
jgi:6-pyruvoyltetrahydropterin/6-carboxytetrahydropterin synthase